MSEVILVGLHSGSCTAGNCVHLGLFVLWEQFNLANRSIYRPKSSVWTHFITKFLFPFFVVDHLKVLSHLFQAASGQVLEIPVVGALKADSTGPP